MLALPKPFSLVVFRQPFTLSRQIKFAAHSDGGVKEIQTKMAVSCDETRANFVQKMFVWCIFFSYIVPKSSVPARRVSRSFSSGLFCLTHQLCVVVIACYSKFTNKANMYRARKHKASVEKTLPMYFFSRLHRVRCSTNYLRSYCCHDM